MYYAVFYVKCNFGDNENVCVSWSNNCLKYIQYINNVYKYIRNVYDIDIFSLITTFLVSATNQLCNDSTLIIDTCNVIQRITEVS